MSYATRQAINWTEQGLVPDGVVRGGGPLAYLAGAKLGAMHIASLQTALPLIGVAWGIAMLLQAITIADQRYERAKRSVDFIQRYIFPGSCLPSVGALSASIAQAYDDAFIRMWEFYCCYCEGGFDERVIGDVQMLLVKPGNRRAPIAATS